jgi:hypothetical protein
MCCPHGFITTLANVIGYANGGREEGHGGGTHEFALVVQIFAFTRPVEGRTQSNHKNPVDMRISRSAGQFFGTVALSIPGFVVRLGHWKIKSYYVDVIRLSDTFGNRRTGYVRQIRRIKRRTDGR